MLTFWQILILMVVAFVLALVVVVVNNGFKVVFRSCAIEDIMKAYGELMDKQFEKQKQNLTDLFKG